MLHFVQSLTILNNSQLNSFIFSILHTEQLIRIALQKAQRETEEGNARDEWESEFKINDVKMIPTSVRVNQSSQALSHLTETS